MPERHRFTSVSTAAVPHSSAHDIVNRALACQSSRFAPDTSFFDGDSCPMRKDTTELMTIVSALVSLLIALLFHVTAVVSVISARMTLIIAPMHHIIRVVSVMIGLTTDMTRILSVLIRIVRVVRGKLSLSKKVLSVLIANDRDVRGEP